MDAIKQIAGSMAANMAEIDRKMGYKRPPLEEAIDLLREVEAAGYLHTVHVRLAERVRRFNRDHKK